MWQYIEYLPVEDQSNIITLGEGNTPICALRRNLFLKLEYLNPTGSYKDRFGSCALSWMKEKGKSRCLATSSGNTGAALAAYCARAGIPCQIFILEATPQAKALQMLAHGATLQRIRGFGVSAEITCRLLKVLKQRAQSEKAALLVSAFTYSPEGMEGVKTIAHELADELDFIEDVFVPVGGGGLLTAVFRGFSEFFQARKIERIPRIHAVQPEGCATVTGPLSKGEKAAVSVQCTSQVSGLQVASVIDGDMALEAVLASEGTGQTVSDSAIYDAQRMLASEGIYCEPAGATAYAGYLQAASRGQVSAASRVVCLMTGHGFKDRESIQRMTSSRTIETSDAEEVSDPRDR